MRTCTLSAALNNPSLIILDAKKMMNVLPFWEDEDDEEY